IVLLLAHHFAKAGSVSLKCDSDGWTGDVLIRDVHVVAVQVAQLYSGDVTYGTGSPQAYYGQDGTERDYLDTNQHEVQAISLPAGTWLIHATTWAYSGNGNELTCKLMFAGATLDQSF